MRVAGTALGSCLFWWRVRLGMMDVYGRVFATDSCLVTYMYMYVTGSIDVVAIIRGTLKSKSPLNGEAR